MVAREFAAMLGYSVEPVMLYQVKRNFTGLVSTAHVRYSSMAEACSLQPEKTQNKTFLIRLKQNKKVFTLLGVLHLRPVTVTQAAD